MILVASKFKSVCVCHCLSCFVSMIRLCAAFYPVQPTDIYCTDAGTRGATQGIEETCTWLRISKGMKRKRDGERYHQCCGMLWHVQTS